MTDAELKRLRPRLDPTQRYHVSRRPVTGIARAAEQPVGDPKPNGFWYGFGDSWLDYLSNEIPAWLEKAQYVYWLEPNTDLEQGLLKISTNEELLKFTRRYGLSTYQPFDGIQWRGVARAWDGIEINPYLRAMRMSWDARWYYSWDIASGCIWYPGTSYHLELVWQAPEIQ